jgi:ubiquinone/menaquinone biosynthesis C-methylase UbiE
MQNESQEFSPFSQYSGDGKGKDRLRKWFHNNRITDFAELIEPDRKILSVGAGNAELEAKLLIDKFDEIYTLDIEREHAETASKKGLEAVQASAPPLPFVDDAFDAIVAAGTIEHLPNEREFISEAQRCLHSSGTLYMTLPIEVGMGGLFRYTMRNFLRPENNQSPEGYARYFDYSLPELRKTIPRESHDTEHRYYNYTHTIGDLEDMFQQVSISGWPVSYLNSLNLILFVRADKHQST